MQELEREGDVEAGGKTYRRKGQALKSKDKEDKQRKGAASGVEDGKSRGYLTTRRTRRSVGREPGEGQREEDKEDGENRDEGRRGDQTEGSSAVRGGVQRRRR